MNDALVITLNYVCYTLPTKSLETEFNRLFKSMLL